MNIGIFSGSFDPIHIGHLILANYIAEFSDVDEVWFLVTPQNPLKVDKELMDENIRFQMTELALEGFHKIDISDIEFSLPRPSYMVNTLEALSKKYPQHTFSLIIGADNWLIFNQWKDFAQILAKHRIYVYPRFGYETNLTVELQGDVIMLDSPIVEVSSTFIRRAIREGKDVKAFLPEKVYSFIKEKGIYK